ncbi:hypothetical protein, partial [Anaerosporobacter sp.]|uniref:hypothetical protein n=1 Tax=Anaerosporobacter sp. TaxID=1872529 RepID=UPI002F3F4531
FNKESNNDVDLKKIEKDYRAIYNNMVVKDKGKVKREINGKTLKCTEYQATILSEDIRTLFNDIGEFGGTSDIDTLDEILQNDIVFTVYVYKNKMVALHSSYDMQVEGKTGTLDVDIDFSKHKILGTVEINGSSNTVTMLFENNITDTESDLTISIKENGEILETASLSSKLDGDNISINGDIRDTEDEAIVTLKCEGSLSNVKKGKSYSINLDKMEFIIGDILTFDMSAEVNVNSDGTIVIPDDTDCTNVFDMTTQDIDEFITDILMNEKGTFLDWIESLMDLYGSTSSPDLYYDDNDFDDIFNDDYEDPYDNELDTDDNSTNNDSITLKDYEDNEIQLICSDKTATIENSDSYAFADMNEGNYYASFFVLMGDSEEDIFNDEFEYYIENYDAELSDLQSYNGYNYKTVTYEFEGYTSSYGYAVMPLGDYYIVITVNISALNEDDSIDDAVQFVLKNITLK